MSQNGWLRPCRSKSATLCRTAPPPTSRSATLSRRGSATPSRRGSAPPGRNARPCTRTSARPRSTRNVIFVTRKSATWFLNKTARLVNFFHLTWTSHAINNFSLVYVLPFWIATNWTKCSLTWYVITLSLQDVPRQHCSTTTSKDCKKVQRNVCETIHGSEQCRYIWEVECSDVPQVSPVLFLHFVFVQSSVLFYWLF